MKRYIRSSHDEDIRLEITDQSDDEMWINIMLGDQVVGDMNVITDFSDADGYCYVERIDIEPDYRNRGIGTEVLKHLLFDTFGWSCRTVVVAPDNADAKRLYERIGSEVSGDVSRVFGDLDQGYGVYEI